MAAACVRSGRAPGAATLVAISKTVPVEKLRLAQAAGHDLLGENRVQEAASKIPLLGPSTWHLVGHLQKNKAAKAIELFDVIESVDSVALATRLDRLVGERGSRAGGPLPVYLQVNVDADPAKAGFTAETLEREFGDVLVLPNLEVHGLMTVGWLTAGSSEARPTFARLRALSEELRATDPRLGPGLSMGMTDDYEVAIEEGSTLVRVGRALFGERTL
ncbi:MAG: YggS family pyridoxal phosphate-dependent enzyme [Chloroflexota bacterium]|nr:YggS family pyridoxal phosphate-dependent enzyme [Chloroflexota bacterium]